MTILELIKSSLRLVGVLAAGEEPQANIAQDAFLSFKMFLKSWSVNYLMVPKVTIESFSILGGQQSYTIGPSGDMNTTRPMKIKEISIKINTGPQAQELPVKIFNYQEWQSNISNKEMTSEIPIYAYVEESSPLMKVYLWPVPTSTTNILIYSQGSIEQTNNINATITLPTGYEEAIVYNFALRMAAEYGREVKPIVKEIADQTRLSLENVNAKPLYLVSDAQGLSTNKNTFDIYRGT